MEKLEFESPVDFDQIVELLDARPDEGAVITELFLEEVGSTAEEVSQATGRPFRRVTEYMKANVPNMLLRERVVWFAPEEEH